MTDEKADLRNDIMLSREAVRRSKQAFDEAERRFGNLLEHPFMQKSAFLQAVTGIKSALDESERDAKLALKIDGDVCERAIAAQRDRAGQINFDLQQLLTSRPLERQTEPGASDGRPATPTVQDWLSKIRGIETRFFEQFSEGAQQHFVELAHAYYGLSESLYVSLLHFLDNKVEDKRGRKYLTLKQGAEVDFFVLDKFDEIADQRSKALLADICTAFRVILDDYYQSEPQVPCLLIVTRRLRLCAKKHKPENLSARLDQQMHDIARAQFSIARMMTDISRIFTKTDTTRVTVTAFMNIFKNFNKILIELELDKPDQAIHLNEYYQYAYLFMFFRVALKIFLVILLQVNQKKIADFNPEAFDN